MLINTMHHAKRIMVFAHGTMVSMYMYDLSNCMSKNHYEVLLGLALIKTQANYRSARNNCGYKTLRSLQILMIFSKMRSLKMRYLLRQESLSFKWLNPWVCSSWLWLHECQKASIIIIRFWIRVKGILITVQGCLCVSCHLLDPICSTSVMLVPTAKP